MAITGWREFPALVGGRRRAAKAGKGRELGGGNYRPREAVPAERSAGAELDAALAAVAWATEDEG